MTTGSGAFRPLGQMSASQQLLQAIKFAAKFALHACSQVCRAAKFAGFLMFAEQPSLLVS